MKVLTWLGKVAMITAVSLYLGIHSLNFFLFTFAADEWYYAPLGFGLTGGAVFVYLLLFMYDAGKSKIKRWTALIMVGVSIVGEITTAYFGMQVNMFEAAGITLTTEDFVFMLFAIRLLALPFNFAAIANKSFTAFALIPVLPCAR